MNKTEIVVKMSFPLVIATGYICYKIGQYSVYIKTAKTIINENSKKDSED